MKKAKSAITDPDGLARSRLDEDDVEGHVPRRFLGDEDAAGASSLRRLTPGDDDDADIAPAGMNKH